jgi:hypothetical protein
MSEKVPITVKVDHFPDNILTYSLYILILVYKYFFNIICIFVVKASYHAENAYLEHSTHMLKH